MSSRPLVIEDVHMCMEACEQFEEDQRALQATGEITEEEARAEEEEAKAPSSGGSSHPKGSMSAKETKALSRKLFGKVARMRREANAHGFDLAKVPCALVQCVRCQRWRVVDARASSALTLAFVCGSVIQIDQEVGCEEADQALGKSCSNSPPAAQQHAFAWLWVERGRWMRD